MQGNVEGLTKHWYYTLVISRFICSQVLVSGLKLIMAVILLALLEWTESMLCYLILHLVKSLNWATSMLGAVYITDAVFILIEIV